MAVQIPFSLPFGAAPQPNAAGGKFLAASGQVVVLGNGAALAQQLSALQSSSFPQTTYWPSLHVEGSLHPLDYITINGVLLPLAAMPSGGKQLDISQRKAQGNINFLAAQHGAKRHPYKIVLKLFRDDSLGFTGGQRVGKDWFAEYQKIQDVLIRVKSGAAFSSKMPAIPVVYPTLAASGCTSLIFTEQLDPQHAGGQFYTVQLEGIDPRDVKSGASTGVKANPRKAYGSKLDPAPPAVPHSGPAAQSRLANLRNTNLYNGF